MLLGIFNIIKLLAYPVFIMCLFICEHLGWVWLAIGTLIVVTSGNWRNAISNLLSILTLTQVLSIVLMAITFLLSLLVGVKILL